MAINDYRATKRTKQVGIKYRAKIHTEACYFTMEKLGANSTNKK